MSFYLKYRPQRFEDLDLASVREQLTQILSSGEFAHAYLFSGPKGTGKTSSARILAQVLNCEKNSKAIEAYLDDEDTRKKLKEPCGECEQCLSIRGGQSMAVVEMDGASNRRIDDIRQLRERIGLAPASGLMSVYVIDEVHMLTTEAFNALLKTLEEPPAHVVFVLCTTEPQKIPDTIISRCTQIGFYKASIAEVVRSLSKVVEGEEIEISKKALEKIAARVDGSFRDGMKVLEQLAGSQEKISEEMVNELTGFSQAYETDTFIEYLLSREVSRALAVLEEKEHAGVDFVVFGERVIEAVRERMLKAVDEGKQAEAVEYSELASQLALAVNESKRVNVPQLPLEMVAVSWGFGGGGGGKTNSKTSGSKSSRKTQKTGDMEKKVSKVSEVSEVVGDSGIGEGQGTEDSEEAVSTEKSNADGTEEVIEKESKVPKVSKAEEAEGNDAVKATDSPSNGAAVSVVEMKERWGDVMQEVKQTNFSLEALLKAAKPVSTKQNRVTLEVYYRFHREQLEQERHRSVLEQTLSKVFETKLSVFFVDGERQEEGKSDVVVANVTGSVEDEELAQVAEEIFG